MLDRVHLLSPFFTEFQSFPLPRTLKEVLLYLKEYQVGWALIEMLRVNK